MGGRQGWWWVYDALNTLPLTHYLFLSLSLSLSLPLAFSLFSLPSCARARRPTCEEGRRVPRNQRSGPAVQPLIPNQTPRSEVDLKLTKVCRKTGLRPYFLLRLKLANLFQHASWFVLFDYELTAAKLAEDTSMSYLNPSVPPSPGLSIRILEPLRCPPAPAEPAMQPGTKPPGPRRSPVGRQSSQRFTRKRDARHCARRPATYGRASHAGAKGGRPGGRPSRPRCAGGGSTTAVGHASIRRAAKDAGGRASGSKPTPNVDIRLHILPACT